MKRATVSPATATLSKGDFNPRPREEGDVALKVEVGAVPNFNPRPREEGDHLFNDITSIFFDISIHALVKRATMRSEVARFLKSISIHALVKRAT